VDTETKLALLEQEVGFLKIEVESVKEDVRNKFDRLEKKLDEALKGRPTWAVTLIITLLSTICTGLVVAFISRGG
jgi:hypothetical protein